MVLQLVLQEHLAHHLESEHGILPRFKQAIWSHRKLLRALVFFTCFACVCAGLLVAAELPYEKHQNELLAARRHQERQERDEEVAIIRALLERFVPVDQGRDAAISNLTALADLSSSLIVEYQEWPKDSDGQDYFHWTYIGSLYYTFTIVTTIGYGNFAPHTTGGRVVTLVAAFIGIPSFAMLLSVVSTAYGDLGFWLYRKTGRRIKSPFGFDAPIIVGPLLVITVYWLVSAAVFLALNYTEPVDGYFWNFADACFFVPITFLTIGLGDLSVSWFGSHAILGTRAPVLTQCPCSDMAHGLGSDPIHTPSSEPNAWSVVLVPVQRSFSSSWSLWSGSSSSSTSQTSWPSPLRSPIWVWTSPGPSPAPRCLNGCGGRVRNMPSLHKSSGNVGPLERQVVEKGTTARVLLRGYWWREPRRQHQQSQRQPWRQPRQPRQLSQSLCSQSLCRPWEDKGTQQRQRWKRRGWIRTQRRQRWTPLAPSRKQAFPMCGLRQPLLSICGAT